jgi:predicted phosphodiesterase
MRVAALYDIHGNMPALEQVLAEVRLAGVDRIVVGGDVLPGPMPRECIDRLLALEVPVSFIHGNGDREVLATRRRQENAALPEQAREAIRWNARELTSEDEHMLASWPATVRMPIDGIGDVLFCHATPRNDTEIFTRLTPEDRLRPIFDLCGAALVVCGHTHMPFDRTVGRTRVVNAGSVGMSFAGPGASWLLLSSAVELHHTMYDLAAAATRVRATSYPQAEAFAARHILTPPSEADTLALFGRVEL